MAQGAVRAIAAWRVPWRTIDSAAARTGPRAKGFWFPHVVRRGTQKQRPAGSTPAGLL